MWLDEALPSTSSTDDGQIYYSFLIEVCPSILCLQNLWVDAPPPSLHEATVFRSFPLVRRSFRVQPLVSQRVKFCNQQVVVDLDMTDNIVYTKNSGEALVIQLHLRVENLRLALTFTDVTCTLEPVGFSQVFPTPCLPGQSATFPIVFKVPRSIPPSQLSHCPRLAYTLTLSCAADPQTQISVPLLLCRYHRLASNREPPLTAPIDLLQATLNVRRSKAAGHKRRIVTLRPEAVIYGKEKGNKRLLPWVEFAGVSQPEGQTLVVTTFQRDLVLEFEEPDEAAKWLNHISAAVLWARQLGEPQPVREGTLLADGSVMEIVDALFHRNRKSTDFTNTQSFDLPLTLQPVDQRPTPAADSGSPAIEPLVPVTLPPPIPIPATSSAIHTSSSPPNAILTLSSSQEREFLLIPPEDACPVCSRPSLPDHSCTPQLRKWKKRIDGTLAAAKTLEDIREFYQEGKGSPRQQPESQPLTILAKSSSYRNSPLSKSLPANRHPYFAKDVGDSEEEVMLTGLGDPMAKFAQNTRLDQDVSRRARFDTESATPGRAFGLQASSWIAPSNLTRTTSPKPNVQPLLGSGRSSTPERARVDDPPSRVVQADTGPPDIQ